MDEQFEFRAPTWDDLSAALELLNKQSRAVSGRADTSEAELKSEWTSPGFSMETDVLLATDGNGRLVGYVDYYNSRGDRARPFCYCLADPDIDDAPVLAELVKWAEARAKQDVAIATEGVKFTVLAGADQNATTTLAAWEAAGFTESRRFHHMRVELRGQLQAPRIPDGYDIRVIREDERRQAFDASLKIFADHYGHVKPLSVEEEFEQWKHHLLEADNSDPNLQFIAVAPDGAIAGLSLCSPADGPDNETGWVNSLGVVREHRAKGLGEALLRHSFLAFESMGKKAAGLGVDADSLTNATRLYEKCGMSATRVFVQVSKVLRDGRESANLG